MEFTVRLKSGKHKGKTAKCRGRINKSGNLVGTTCKIQLKPVGAKKTTRRRRRRRVA